MSQRQQEKSRLFSKTDNSGSSSVSSGEQLLIQTLVRGKGALIYIDGMQIPSGSNNKNGNGENHISRQPPAAPAVVELEDQQLSEELLANDSLGG